MTLNVQHIKTWLLSCNEKIQENKVRLSDLDQAIGDGDHGFNMARGFEEGRKRIAQQVYDTPADILRDFSTVLISKVGGASGPLYGTAFLKMAMSLKGINEVDYTSLKASIQSALEGIKKRGKAEENEKTMIDVWSPALEFMKQHDTFDSAGFNASIKEAMESTKEMKATKGRASYLKERSIGHLDPGAVSSYYILSSLADIIEKDGALS
ncbi:dihydroxyacetone kinase subunit DhaL [Bacillus sp. 1P06AnD]|uniref:dihydroxyacetone kinase subunit DhaL n=1 Tax=Bacillus sp. 1P06AnD TaxID=3132208 RepID=UPI0039A10C83